MIRHSLGVVPDQPYQMSDAPDYVIVSPESDMWYGNHFGYQFCFPQWFPDWEES